VDISDDEDELDSDVADEMSDPDEAAESGGAVPRLGGLFGRQALPLAVPVTIIYIQHRRIYIWPRVQHTAFSVAVRRAPSPSSSPQFFSLSSSTPEQVAKNKPARLIVEVTVTELSDAQVKQIVTVAMRGQRTFDEVDDADFSRPAPIEPEQLAAILHGNSGGVALRSAVHRAPTAEKKEAAQMIKCALFSISSSSLPPQVRDDAAA
jgi:hypothetical protein